MPGSLLFYNREKALKAKSACVLSAYAQGGYNGTWPRYRHNFNSPAVCLLNQNFPRVGNTRCACVTANGTGFPGYNSVYDFIALITQIMGIIADHRLSYIKVIEKFNRYPCVLGGYKIRLLTGLPYSWG